MYTNDIKRVQKYILEKSKEYFKKNILSNEQDALVVYTKFVELSNYRLNELLPEISSLSDSEFKAKYYLIICCIVFDYALNQIEETKGKSDKIIIEMIDYTLSKLPKWKKQYLGKSLMSIKKKNKYKAMVKKIENEKLGKMDFRISFKEKSKEEFSINVFECAGLKLAKKLAQNSENVFPTVCKLDYVIAKHLGYKLQRDGTLAEGAACCDFNFTYPGVTEYEI